MPTRPESTTWTEHDEAIWHTGDIARALLAGRIHERPAIATTFPPRFDPTERMLATGTFELSTYRTPSRAATARPRSWFLVGRPRTLAIVNLFAALLAARHRFAVDADTSPRWLVSDGGDLTVSTHGLYLRTESALSPWSWSDFTSMELLGPAFLALTGSSSAGPVTWRLRSTWAELVLVVWALSVHPSHPSALGGRLDPHTSTPRRPSTASLSTALRVGTSMRTPEESR